ncbi:MAG: hypothetical protein ACI9JM_002805 [Halioglobus sp.]|jgi:hypothetical protein
MAISTNPNTSALPLRDANEVMQLERLGSLHQCRLSFMRSLIRKIVAEQWSIKCSLFELDDQGYGTAVYTIHAQHHSFSFVVFADYLSDEDRNDRVIATKWDLTMALHIGEVNTQQIEMLRANVPKQEAGRVTTDTMVLSRANRSGRNFEYVVNELAAGRQPSIDTFKDAGYIYRTTAVYGSGKFGMADWDKVRSLCPDFARPFSAEMFTCYMLRHFSVEQTEYLARMRAPKTAVTLDLTLRRYIGIGNATGLGMAPYLIKHPQLIAQWITARETAIARVLHEGQVNSDYLQQLNTLAGKAKQHFQETNVADEIQTERNRALIAQLTELQDWLQQDPQINNWTDITVYARQQWHMETQELIHSLLMEMYPELVDDLEDHMCVDENTATAPQMPLQQLKLIIETSYRWALDIDFERAEAQYLFWYRSEEKMEPRIGERFTEEGMDREMPLLTVARYVRQCYDHLCDDLLQHGDSDVVHFLMRQPEMNGITARIQTMAQEPFGDIQANLADKEILPIQLLRCKLSFFGVSKFDPKSKYWVRNTMFQGAPLLTDFDKPFADDWYFPLAPEPS